LDGLLDYFHTGTIPLTLNNLNVLMVPLFMACFYKVTQNRNRKLEGCLAIMGVLILVLHTYPTEISPFTGVLPYLSNIVHLASACVWGGCVLIMIILPWSKILDGTKIDRADLRGVFIRFSVLSVSMLTLILLTGAILSVANVHSMDAISSTSYGKVLSLKLGLVIILFMFMLFEFSRRPLVSWKKEKQFENDAGILLKEYYRPALYNGLLIVFTLGASIVLSTYSPPDTPPFLNPQTWHMNTGEYPVSIEMQPVTGSTTRIRFEIFVPEELMQAQGTTMDYDLYLNNSEIGIFGGSALQASQNSFLGESVIPMPGTWKLELSVDRPGFELVSGDIDIAIPSLPLIDDLKTYLSLSAITYSKAKTVTFIIGAMLVVVYLWIVWRTQQGIMNAKFTILGVSGVVIGVYLLMSVLLVKTYPSTYWKNPQAYTSAVINAGRSTYIDKCAECHGDSGQGDGSWAIENRGAIPALSSPHIDVHTDGEIYWWITHGIPSLEMPPLEDEINEDQRWQIIHFVRSLRHGIP
jgi:putative copper export protein